MICLDANFVLEIILDRKLSDTCRDYLKSLKEDLALTVSSVAIIMYYVEKHSLQSKDIESFLRKFNWLPLTEIDVEWAFTNYKKNDFEDALQISVAKREQCSKFVTLDKKLKAKYINQIPIKLFA